MPKAATEFRESRQAWVLASCSNTLFRLRSIETSRGEVMLKVEISKASYGTLIKPEALPLLPIPHFHEDNPLYTIEW